MNIIYTPNLPEVIRESTLVIDACVIIDATKDPDFCNFLVKMVNDYDISLITVPAVKHEVLCAADNKAEYDELRKFIKALNIVFLPSAIEDRLEREGEVFSIAMRRSKHVNKPSFVDRLILSVPFLYRKSSEKIFVITSNHRDIPLDFFDREAFIVRDNGKEFSETGIYKLNLDNFDKTAKRI